MSIAIDLSGKIALVTGATGQLGRTIVTTLATAGADVAIHYRHNEKTAKALYEEVTRLGKNAIICRGDVGNMDDVLAMKQVVEQGLGAPHIVVANAVSQIFPWRTVLEENLEDYENQFRSCVMQNVHLAKAFIPAMAKAGYGRYIGINTECAIQLLETQSAYAQGKRGMDGVLRVLMREVGPNGVTVNQVAPGWTISYKDRQRGTEDQPDYIRNVPLRRRGTDQEVANTVAFLASNLASFITGAFLPVNGGNAICAI